jgi:mycofactocin system glycosyltransferase
MKALNEGPSGSLNEFINCFTFNLEKGVKMSCENDDYMITSASPMRIVRLNQKLYELVDRLIAGSKLYELTRGRSIPEKISTAVMVLSLVAKGYLKLEYDPECSGEENYPTGSIIIPVKNRPEEIRDCLTSLAGLDYPRDKVEVVVVDDGSTDDTASAAGAFDVRLIRQPASRGPSFCRNLGAKEASGEVLAFIDSDCTSDPLWLKQLIPYLAFDGIGAVGGYVRSYYNESALDKYEAVCSSLNMGSRIIFDREAQSSFYVPTCNLLVRKDVFDMLNGFNDSMHLGEDVDFCWRMRKSGNFLVYVPTGAVAHKHRNEITKMLKRKYEYGTSEPDLYHRHQEKEKIFPAPVYASITFLILLTAAISGRPILLFAILILLGIEFINKYATLKKVKTVKIKPMALVWANLKNTVSTYYYISFHLVRYYLILLAAACLVFPSAWRGVAIIILISSLVNYYQKKPKINYISFMVYYLLEHLSYQIGVFAGCVKIKNFRCYSLRLRL